jgi:hypothetical protein
MIAINGYIYRIISDILALAIPPVMNNRPPTGGVHPPRVIAIQTSTPK